MQKYFKYTNDEGQLCIVHGAPKEHLERIFGELSEQQYYNLVRKNIPEHAVEISKEDIPTDREFREAWSDKNNKVCHDLNKVKDIQLDRLRKKRQEEFNKLGLQHRLPDSIEQAFLSDDIKEKLRKLRDITEPLKTLEVKNLDEKDGIARIKQLGQFNVDKA